MSPCGGNPRFDLSRLLNRALARTVRSNRQFRTESLSSPCDMFYTLQRERESERVSAHTHTHTHTHTHQCTIQLPLPPLSVSGFYRTLLDQRSLNASWVYLCSCMHERAPFDRARVLSAIEPLRRINKQFDICPSACTVFFVWSCTRVHIPGSTVPRVSQLNDRVCTRVFRGTQRRLLR